MIRDTAGQLLVEAILAIALIGILAGIIGATVSVSSQANNSAGKRSKGMALAQEAVEAVRAIRDNNDTTSRGWNKLYGLTEGNEYHPDNNGGAGPWSMASSAETLSIDGVSYGRKIVFDKDVLRDQPNGGGNVNTSGTSDPSTIKAIVTVTASGIPDIIIEEYLVRSANDTKVWDTQADMTGGTCSSTTVTSGGNVELGSGGC